MNERHAVVHKYPLGLDVVQRIRTGVNSQILHFDVQAGVPTLWLRVDMGEPQDSELKILLAGTSHLMGDRWYPYIGTVLLNQGTLVLHAFDITGEDTGEL